jgi:hypothetical protein
LPERNDNSLTRTLQNSPGEDTDGKESGTLQIAMEKVRRERCRRCRGAQNVASRKPMAENEFEDGYDRRTRRIARGREHLALVSRLSFARNRSPSSSYSPSKFVRSKDRAILSDTDYLFPAPPLSPPHRKRADQIIASGAISRTNTPGMLVPGLLLQDAAQTAVHAGA